LIALTSVWTIACGTTPAADGGAGSAPIVNNGTAGAAGSVTSSPAVTPPTGGVKAPPNTPAPVAGGVAPVVPAAGSGAPVEPGGCATFDSSFAAIQKVIFEGHGCTASACHGQASSGGLDLRPEVSYEQLINAKSSNSKYARVQPGTATDSFLYQKLAAATNPDMVKTMGSPMPVGAPALSPKELEAVRIWILQSAPKVGNVGDPVTGNNIGTLLDACVPPAKPIKAVPLAAPPAAEGVQFVLPGYLLKSGIELEQCVPFVYDFTDKIPAQYKDVTRNVMFVNGSRVLQDPSSHHMVVWNPDKTAATVPATGWTCAGGARHGQACSGTSLDCGAESVCAGPATPGTLCDFDTQAIASNNADPFATLTALGTLLTTGLPAQVANTQSPQEYVPPFEGGVYSELPLKGVLWFNSHAFNLTSEDTVLDARMNFYFTNDRKRLMVPVNVVKNEVPDGLAPFTKQTYCSTAVVPPNNSIAMMTGHTHRHGQHFWAKDSLGKTIYESYVYNDPIYQHYEPWLEFNGADEKSRTIEFCAEFNNGLTKDGTPDVKLVTRKSKMPPPNATCTPVACTAGKIGAKCSANADCDSTAGAKDGECDACPITTGLTTENEMFVLMPWYVQPAK
ncbi:MAG: hypothetical protein RL701_3630, partial [Pseudomonadota bacterium]